MGPLFPFGNSANAAQEKKTGVGRRAPLSLAAAGTALESSIAVQSPSPGLAFQGLAFPATAD